MFDDQPAVTARPASFPLPLDRSPNGYLMPTARTNKQWLTAGTGLLLALCVAVAAGWRALGPQQAPGESEATVQEGDEGLSQPIQFPHDTHAGQFQIDCQYCHFSAERSVDAGIPPVDACMGCHQVVPGRTNPEEVAKLREYHESGTPIPWKRIYKVSDHVTFPHFRHVAAGVECQTCHGQVQEMGVLEAVAPEAGNLKMGWCVSCHLERGASRDCTVCHY